MNFVDDLYYEFNINHILYTQIIAVITYDYNKGIYCKSKNIQIDMLSRKEYDFFSIDELNISYFISTSAKKYISKILKLKAFV